MKRFLIIPILINLMIFATTAIQRSNYEIKSALTIPLELNVSPEPVRQPEEIQCYMNPQCQKLAEAIFFEGRGESRIGQIAIAYTIINRRDSWKWPDTVKEVVDEKRGKTCQFSYHCELTIKEKIEKIENELVAWNSSLSVAYEVFNFSVPDVTNGADHYYNPKEVKYTPKFAKVYAYVDTIGNHKFFRSN